ncbi:MAG: hypothetical protein NT061_07660 [Spirochaetes bacterium]|nr:hypothetical protein [Spirochaetota bacterium]
MVTVNIAGKRPQAIPLAFYGTLDRRTKTDVYKEFLALRGELAMSVILVSHDRILEVEDGNAVALETQGMEF